jgi:hypothetical protein
MVPARRYLLRAVAALTVLGVLASVLRTGPARGAVGLDLDEYGGVKVLVSKPTGSFTRAKVGDRWVLVTPAGNAFWMLGVFLVDVAGSIDDLKDSYANRIVTKYGSKPKWAEQTVKRLKMWGFNTLAEYATEYVLPTRSQYGHINAEKMPYVALMRPAYYGLRNQWNAAPGPVKDIIAATDPRVYTGWRGNGTPDVFDPNFQAYVEASARGRPDDAKKSPWFIGLATDDADNIVGFGPGPEVPAPRIHPHIAWLVLVANFQQPTNKALGVTYADPKVYAKYALRDFLKAKYETVEALNAAWRAHYTSWESDGGWPAGKGFLDESGRSSWVGNDFDRLLKASPGVRADLDAFLYQFAKRYFSVTAGAIRKHLPGKLVFGPASLNGWGGLTRKEILRAAGESVDVLQTFISTQQVVELTGKYAGDVPIVTWTAAVANPDSSLWRYPNPEGVTVKTQDARGEAYKVARAQEFNGRSASGNHPIVGMKFWALTDSWGEKANFGLVSFLDNAYDGREAVRGHSKDPWGFPVGGEERDYGDFLTTVTRTNTHLLRQFRDEVARTLQGVKK